MVENYFEVLLFQFQPSIQNSYLLWDQFSKIQKEDRILEIEKSKTAILGSSHNPHAQCQRQCNREASTPQRCPTNEGGRGDSLLAQTALSTDL